MSRWTTVGEVVAYEKGYTEGRADAIQRQWIPCTPETMPKMTDTYLVKVGINENGEGMHTEVRTAEWGAISRTWYVHEHENRIIGEITEWMPSPRKDG